MHREPTERCVRLRGRLGFRRPRCTTSLPRTSLPYGSCMLETSFFQYCISNVHKIDKITNIFKRRYDLVVIWLLLLFLKFQANAKSFDRVMTLFLGVHFSSGHSVYIIAISHKSQAKNHAS